MPNTPLVRRRAIIVVGLLTEVVGRGQQAAQSSAGCHPDTCRPTAILEGHQHGTTSTSLHDDQRHLVSIVLLT